MKLGITKVQYIKELIYVNRLTQHDLDGTSHHSYFHGGSFFFGLKNELFRSGRSRPKRWRNRWLESSRDVQLAPRGSAGDVVRNPLDSQPKTKVFGEPSRGVFG